MGLTPKVGCIVVFSCFVVPVLQIKGENGCKLFDYLDCIPNKALEGHVIKSSTIIAPGLQICQNKCFNENDCVSYNLGPVDGAIRTCELNAMDHWSLSTGGSSALVSKTGYEYCPIENQCSSNPCQGYNKPVCRPNFDWNSYTCQAGLWSAWPDYPCTCPTRTRTRSCINPINNQPASDCGQEESQQTLNCNYTVDISDCKAPLGMQDGSIPNAQITSTGHHSSHCSKNNARLNATNNKAWCTNTPTNIGTIYIQIDLGTEKKVTQVATQGRTPSNQWVKTFTLSFSVDKINWIDYIGDGQCTVHFIGNIDNYSVVTNKLPVPVTARYVRVYPQLYNVYPSLRLEFYGC